MNISVIGCGYVGLVTAACLVEMGHTVAATDNDYAKLPLLRQGLSPIYEEHLPQLLQLGFESKSLAIKLWKRARNGQNLDH